MEYMIQIEINKNEEINKRNNVNETPEEVKSRLSNIGFSQVLSYTNSMIEFQIDKEFMKILKVLHILKQMRRPKNILKNMKKIMKREKKMKKII